MLIPSLEGLAPLANVSFILVANPRLAFARAIAEFFVELTSPGISPTAKISPDCVIGPGVYIGEFATIGRRCRIGGNTTILNNVVIGDNVVIGERCVVKSNSVVGEAGFGIVKDENGDNRRLPHIGGVIIGDDVEIGSLNTVCSGTVDPTIIEDFVKTDDHVHIAHNCVIKRNSIITSCSSIAGSTVIEENVWLGPNCSIMNGIVVGRDAFVGLGAAVMAGCERGATLAAFPARQVPKK
jgi:UDP-3-O-[3-hydroxymyristoyl] glucosamine N-acyltransferase